jgi:hypothetical protein
LRAAGGDRHEIEIAGHARGDLCLAGQRHEARFEPLLLEDARHVGDVARNMQAVTADHLADRDLGLRVSRRGDNGKRGGRKRHRWHSSEAEQSHGRHSC